MLESLSLERPIAAARCARKERTDQRQAGRSVRRSTITNAALYQAGWFGCVLAAAAGRPWLAVAAALVPAALHVLMTFERRRTVALLVAAGGLGFLVDTLTVLLGILDFAAPLGLRGAAPVWIVAMWIQFAMTMNFSFGWLSRRYILAAVFGAIGGPLSFLAGSRLGAVEIGSPTATSLLLLGALWAVALPALVAMADRLSDSGRVKGRYRFDVSPVAAAKGLRAEASSLSG